MSDSHKGGDLFEMAKDGTNVPGDAGKQNTTPSVPNPDQNSTSLGGLGGTTLHSAADNPIATQEKSDDEAVRATGHAVPASTFSKPSGTGGK